MDPFAATLETSIDADRLTLRPVGRWTLHAKLPPLGVLLEALERDVVHQVAFDCAALEGWDSRLAVFVRAVAGRCDARGIGEPATI